MLTVLIMAALGQSPCPNGICAANMASYQPQVAVVQQAPAVRSPAVSASCSGSKSKKEKRTTKQKFLFKGRKNKSSCSG